MLEVRVDSALRTNTTSDLTQDRQPDATNADFGHDNHRLTTAEACAADAQGAATTAYAAVTEGLEEHSGAYLTNCQISSAATAGQDEQLAADLWRVSEQQIDEALQAARPA